MERTVLGEGMAAGPSSATLPGMTVTARSLRHVRSVVPLEFPEREPDSERMGQGGRHYRMCAALYEILRAATQGAHTVACDAFLYFDAADPQRKLAPDASVKLGILQHDVDSWKAWERGAPELAFEILSSRESPERWTFEEKLERYRAAGVAEVVVYHVEGEPGRRLRVWDRIDGDLVERVVEDETTPCLALGLTLVLAPIGDLPACLRLASASGALVPTPAEELEAAKRQLAELAV
jgi:Uma2 family endonuclease